MDISGDEPIYTVSQLNQEVRQYLESHIASVWISGEISNFVCPSSGHWYFTLKDAMAGVRCAFFQPRQRGIRFKPENGMQVLLHAKVSLYEARGEFQLIADFIEPAGDGLLQKAFNQLKEKLQAEGLFATESKIPIPSFPQTIGIVTSPTGAAIRDILSVLSRRFPLLKIILYPCAVQGNLAAGEIVSAIQIANQRNECDVLIIGRGGGSLEDLWPFNEESVARAIFASQIPTISAVGHEIDFTIADFVADLRAPTPSAAAELVSPDQQDILQQLQKIQQKLIILLEHQLIQKQQHLHHLMQRLRHPSQRLQDQSQQLDQLEQRLQRAIQLLLQQKQQQFAMLGRALHTISPLATLDRGYALLQHSQSSQVISSVSIVTVGDKITARLRDGQLLCEVQHIEKNV